MALPKLSSPVSKKATVTMMEQHYSVRELADKWGFSLGFIRTKFQDKPGVIQIPNRSGKRSYHVMRIPESVARKVYEEMQV